MMLISSGTATLWVTDPGAGRKGSTEVLSLGRRHPHPSATALALVTDTVFSITIRIARALTHAGVSWTCGAGAASSCSTTSPVREHCIYGPTTDVKKQSIGAHRGTDEHTPIVIQPHEGNKPLCQGNPPYVRRLLHRPLLLRGGMISSQAESNLAHGSRATKAGPITSKPFQQGGPRLPDHEIVRRVFPA